MYNLARFCEANNLTKEDIIGFMKYLSTYPHFVDHLNGKSFEEITRMYEDYLGLE